MTTLAALAAEPPMVAHDRFPVSVTTPDHRTLATARVILTTDGRLLVWIAPGDPAYDAWVDPVAQVGVFARADWHLDTDDGEFTVRRGRGCGCSNPLKVWSPWPMRMPARRRRR